MTRILLVAAALSVLALPLATAHTMLLHPDAVSTLWSAPFRDEPGMVGIALLSLLAAVPLTRMLAAFWRWEAASTHMRRLSRLGVPQQLGTIDYVQVPGNQIAFFTAGIRRPTIYVTDGAAQSLAAGPFSAGLLHERAHARRHDVRWLALLAGVEKAWAPVPWSRETFHAVRLLTERAADEAALAAGADKQDLFDAIVSASASPSGAGLAGAGVEQRLRWLVDEDLDAAIPKRGVATLIASFAAPPGIAHLLFWAGIVCSICSSHLMD